MNKKIFASLLFLLGLLLCSVLLPLLINQPSQMQDLGARLQPPSRLHWMGTDFLGRDLFFRVIQGVQVSLLIGCITAFLSLGVGMVYGALAAYIGGRVDAFLMRIVDLFYTFPSLLIAILLVAFIGYGTLPILLAISSTGWVTQARLARAQVLKIRKMLHVEAAEALGLSTRQILINHVVPLLWGPVLISVMFQIPQNIMTESFLSFLGLGIQPPLASLGSLASEGLKGMQSYPHLIIGPGLILFSSLLSFQILGDELRKSLDPHQTFYRK